MYISQISTVLPLSPICLSYNRTTSSQKSEHNLKTRLVRCSETTLADPWRYADVRRSNGGKVLEIGLLFLPTTRRENAPKPRIRLNRVGRPENAGNRKSRFPRKYSSPALFYNLFSRVDTRVSNRPVIRTVFGHSKPVSDYRPTDVTTI